MRAMEMAQMLGVCQLKFLILRYGGYVQRAEGKHDHDADLVRRGHLQSPENGHGQHGDARVNSEVERVHRQIRRVDITTAAVHSLVPVEGDRAAEQRHGEDVADGPEDAGAHHGVADVAEGARAGEDVRVEEEDGAADGGHGDGPEELDRDEELEKSVLSRIEMNRGGIPCRR